MAVHAPALPRPDVWHGRFGPTLAIALVVLPFAALLAWGALTMPASDETDAAASIRDTAAVVDAHGTAMIEIGERVSDAASASTAADRATWAAYGQHLISDGRGLHDLAQRLRDTATVAETDPLHKGYHIALDALAARWQALRADGVATADHGRFMVVLADEMSSGVAAGTITAEDQRALASSASGMIDAGERTVHAADLLIASTDQMQRWTGNP